MSLMDVVLTLMRPELGRGGVTSQGDKDDLRSGAGRIETRGSESISEGGGVRAET